MALNALVFSAWTSFCEAASVSTFGLLVFLAKTPKDMDVRVLALLCDLEKPHSFLLNNEEMIEVPSSLKLWQKLNQVIFDDA